MYEMEQALPIPLIVVRRPYFDEFLAGTKTTEFRRHRRPFTERVFYAGRRAAITFRYNLAPRLPATVMKFEARPLIEVPEMIGFYEGMSMRDEVALIHLAFTDADLVATRRALVAYPGLIGQDRPA
jgi:hypothetical protein